MSGFTPKNLTAQLRYRGRGNPPAAHPETAVGNFFPGLEFNFQNVWKRIFIGVELLEYGGQVIGVIAQEAVGLTPEERTELATVNGGFLANVDGKELVAPIRGPVEPDGPDQTLGQIYLEWSNSLAKVHAEKGGTELTAACIFVVQETVQDANGNSTTRDVRKGPFALRVRRLIEPDQALISPDASEPGEITESLCSPWQTDYIGCACYYWASNRPDYVNVVDAGDGVSAGHNWLNLGRDQVGGRPVYTLRSERLLTHEDVMQDWEHRFHFVIKGRDVRDGVVRAEADTASETFPVPLSEADERSET